MLEPATGVYLMESRTVLIKVHCNAAFISAYVLHLCVLCW